MKKLLFIGFLVLNIKVVFAQVYSIGHASWTDSLRKHLVLDSVYCRDSIITFDAYDTLFELRITKKRPDINKAIVLIDSISRDMRNDTTFARLITILNEFDIKYLSEFVYTIDYFQETYHRSTKELRRNNQNELDLIEKMENTLLLSKILESKSISFLDFLLDRSLVSEEIQIPYSTTWKRYGNRNIGTFLEYYNDNHDKFENELKIILRKDLEINEFYTICYIFNLFNRNDSSKINCIRLNNLIDEKTSLNFIKALTKLNKKFHQNSCLNSIISKY